MVTEKDYIKEKLIHAGFSEQHLEEQSELIRATIEATKRALSIANVSNRFDPKYTPPFRVGRKQGKAVLDANGIEVVFFNNSEEQAKKYCNYLNGC